MKRNRPLKVMLVAVEASADALGAGLARALKGRLGDDVEFVGVGGARMAEAGIASPVDIAGLSLVGLFEIAAAVPRALNDLEATIRLAEAEQPDVAVLIDSWEFTWRVARRLRLRTPRSSSSNTPPRRSGRRGPAAPARWRAWPTISSPCSTSRRPTSSAPAFPPPSSETRR